MAVVDKVDSKVKRELLMEEATASVQLAGIMTAGVFFALSLLLTNFSPKLLAPVIFLFLSLFGSIYSAIIYANATGQLSRLSTIKKAKRTLVVGNVISEFFGVYPLVFAFPIAFLAFTNTTTAVLVLFIDMIGYVFYHTPGDVPGSYSIIERYSSKVTYGTILVFCSLLVGNFIINLLNIQTQTYLPFVFLVMILTLLAHAILAIYCLLGTEKASK